MVTLSVQETINLTPSSYTYDQNGYGYLEDNAQTLMDPFTQMQAEPAPYQEYWDSFKENDRE